jgi:hypothetical protein
MGYLIKDFLSFYYRHIRKIRKISIPGAGLILILGLLFEQT